VKGRVITKSMKTKAYNYPWGRGTVLAVLLIFLFTHLRGEGLANFVRAGEPVWGRKPVLAYFVLTVSLSEELKTGAGLTDAEFQIVQEIALQEATHLTDLERTANTFIQDDALTYAEKRAKIAEMDYNAAVAQTISENQNALQSALDAETYTRLVNWIEARWQIERVRHGAVQTSKSPNAARTYSIFATHYDSNGSYAVALPDKCVKFADGGNSICNGSGYSTGNYSVQLSYDDSTTVQTFDSGPWNVDDNFWAAIEDPHPRRLFTDLPMGMPAAQAAYFDDYNDGFDQFDRVVTAPFAIDLGDDVGGDIGLEPGNNDWIEVTFLWTDGWDSINPEVVALLEPTDLEPPYTGDMCVTAWHQIFPDLVDGGKEAYLTLNVNDPAQSTNSAEWVPDIPVAGEYIVRAFVPDHDPIDWLCPQLTIDSDTTDAEYIVHHAEGETSVSKNQGPMANQYLDLGTFEFEAGTDGKVELSDLNDEENLTHTIAFSAMVFQQVVPLPTPTPTPTPTPIPDPYVQAGFGIANPGEDVTIPVHAGNLLSPGVGLAVMDVHFDPGVVDAVSCQADPGGLFDTETCEPNFEADGVFPDIVRVTLDSATGVSGDPLLATLTFQAVGTPTSFSWVELFLVQFIQPGGGAIPAGVYSGMVCIAPCENLWFLPAIFK
jgi:hypothetical protein